jgi:hypothetical protein
VGNRPDLRLDLYLPGERRRWDHPALTCFKPCTFHVLPGRYFVRVTGPKGSDVHQSGEYFDIEGPARVTVTPPSSFLRWFGLGLGIVGPVVALGVSYASLTQYQFREGGTPPALAVAGVASLVVVTPLGWTFFALNRAPSVDVTAMGVR